MLGIGLLIVISLSSISEVEHIAGSQGGASMYGSSDMPSLHRKCSKIGSKGLIKIGRKQLSLALSNAAVLYKEIFSDAAEYILEIIVTAVSV